MERKFLINTARIKSNGKTKGDITSFKAIITQEGVQNGFVKEWSELKKSAWTAGNRPVVINHPDTGPVMDYNLIKGYLSDIKLLEKKKQVQATVNIFNENKDLIKQIQDKEITEVSVGFWAAVDYLDEPVEGQVYGFERDMIFDHLALLPDDLGACSNLDGCGIMPDKEKVNFNVVKITDIRKNTEINEGGDIGMLKTDKEIMHNRAIPYKDLGQADPSEPWNFNAADYSIDDLKMACAWMADKPDNELTKADFKLPHHDLDGKSNLHGVRAAGAAIMGARGGVDIPAADLDGVKAHLEKEYEAFGEMPPWIEDRKKEQEVKQMEKEIDKLTAQLEDKDKIISEQRAELERYKEIEENERKKRIEAKRNALKEKVVLSEEELARLDTEEKLEAALLAIDKVKEDKPEATKTEEYERGFEAWKKEHKEA